MPRSNYCFHQELIEEVSEYLDAEDLAAYSLVSHFHRVATAKQRRIQNLLLATVYGLESTESNAFSVLLTPEAKARFFKSPIAQDILRQFPKLLLAEGKVTDWFGRTFEKVTAFKLALWMKDWKMIEMMLRCVKEAKISVEERDEILASLLKQYKQVRAPVEKGGGLTYSHKYPRPNLSVTTDPVTHDMPLEDAKGQWDRIEVTEVCTSNHFDMMPVLNAYENYVGYYYARSEEQNLTYFAGLLNLRWRYMFTMPALQWMPNLGYFEPFPNSNDAFKRSFFVCIFKFLNWNGVWPIDHRCAIRDLDFLRHLDTISTTKMETLENDLQPGCKNSPQL